MGNVDNTADIDKPVSNAVSSAIITATTDMATKAYVNQQGNLKADVAYVNSKDGDLATLTTTDKTSLVKAINEVVSVKANKADVALSISNLTNNKADKATTLVGYGISNAYTKSEIDTNYGGVKTLYDKNVAAGAGANGWTDLLIKLANGRTQRDKNSEIVSIKDFGAIGDNTLHRLSEKYTTLAAAQAVYPHATALTDSIDWAAAQKAVNNAKNVFIPDGLYKFGTNALIIPNTLSMLKGTGTKSVIYSDAATAISWDTQNRVLYLNMSDFNLLGSNVANSKGLDLSGFSYCIFSNMQIRYFNDGLWGDGTVFNVPYNRQISNNLFNNVRSNNNANAGFKLVGASEANSANTFVSCEAAGNKYGFYEEQGYCNVSKGCCYQGNSMLDFYTNGTNGIHDFYAEGQPKSVKFDTNAKKNDVNCRSSYPLWNTFVDLGVANKKSVRGEHSKQVHIFKNPYFTNWVTAIPSDFVANGSVVFDYFADATIQNGGGLQVTFNANYQGIILSNLDTSESLAGKWVTVEFEADTSGITDLSGLRAYTRDGSTNNGTVGEFFVSNFTKTSAGQYQRYTADIKFAETLAGTPSILIYLAYSGATTSNIIKFKSIKVILGQYASVGDYAFSVFPKTANSTTLSNPTMGINKAFKYSGKVIYNSTLSYPVVAQDSSVNSAWLPIRRTELGTNSTLASAAATVNTVDKYVGKFAINNDNKKMYFATGANATDVWRATDGSGDIAPV